MFTNSYICLDTEATGLSPKHDKIIEIGAIKVIEGEIVDTFSTYVNPGRKLSEKIVELTGITDEALKDAPDIDKVIEDFVFFGSDLPLLGHHIISDYAIIKQAAVNKKIAFDKQGIDTLRISRVLFPELPSKRLKDMCDHFGIKLDAHRALNDAIATHELYKCLVSEASREESIKLFAPAPLKYQAKKETPIRKAQIERLTSLIERHEIKDFNYEIEKMSCNEASRVIDKILAQYGK